MILLLLTMIVGTYGTDKFAVTGTGCTTNGACFQSLNYPNDYGPSESCSITVQSVSAGETLSSAAFNTDSYDKLVVKDVEYSGTSGPSGVTVGVNDVFTWSGWSGGEIEQRSGFEVCLVGACLKTDGIQANAGACRCGTAACSLSTGLFCTSSTNTCRHAPCSVEDGSSVNSESCACGTSDCTSSSGLFCTSSINTCHQLSQLPVYKERTSGNCGDSGGEGKITSAAACEAGAAALGWSGTTADTQTYDLIPPGCFVSFSFGELSFNTDSPNYACSSYEKCLCTLTCPPGTYQDQLGQSECKACAPGTYQDEAGKNKCKSCGVGEYQDITGQSECKPCNAGEYQDQPGQSECKSCNAGEYQDEVGQIECIECGNGKYSLGGSKCVTKEKFKAAYSTQSAQSC
tara:strand:- start:175 stop:1380 length:1206 start_codon:yes stop_codon:yes gene_type:complete